MCKINKMFHFQTQLQSDMVNFSSKDELEGYVSWAALEDALKGIRAELEPKERVVIEQGNQTDPVSSTVSFEHSGSYGPI